ncbi:MAG: SAM-dependent DNA methyltransferase [Deltaproteobacteria bacterium]|nr:SAM-dependent DNA methyltransferase [Deltaproteobacteria bacterium]
MQELSEHKTGHEKLDDSIRNTISSAFQQVGYSEKEKMLLRDICFVWEGEKSHEADMVAYSSSLRQDADTAVISVKGTENTDRIQFDLEISPFRALATPVIVLAEYKKIRGMAEPRVITVGLCKDAATFKRKKAKSEIIPLSRFEEYLRDKQQFFTPRCLEKAKLVPEQLTLFDIAPNLIGQAIQIANKELVERFEKGIGEILKTTNEKYKQSVINAAIAVLGARILRDRLKKNWPLVSSVELLSSVNRILPEYFKVPKGIAERLDPLLGRFHSAFDFSQVSLDMVGKFYASAFRMPIEELPPNNRILADPTCGSGSLLMAGYERLADAAYLSIPRNERHQRLVNTIFGNDNDEFAVKIARMTLMLFHPPHKNNWKVTRLDAEKENFGRRWTKEIKVRPTIIVANPPFGGKIGGTSNTAKPRTRHQRDRSALILNHCLDILPEGGLLGIILTETVLDQILEKSTRHRIIQKCQILEQWDIPVGQAGWFDEVNRPAMAWILRKTTPSSNKIYVRSLSDAPSLGRNAKLQGTIQIDVTNPPDHLVPTVFDDILSKMEMSPNRIDDYYIAINGFQANKSTITKNKLQESHPWSGTNVRGTTPYSDFSGGSGGWLELIDDNLRKGRTRKKLRKYIDQNDPHVMLRANRNVPLFKYKWSSIALVDVPYGSRKVVAPSENFHVTFSRSNDKHTKDKYTYVLWAVLNHSLAGLWFHERLRGPKIPIPTYKKFPLPKDWNLENIQSLASIAKKLIDTKRNMNSKPLLESQDNLKIKDMVNEIDDVIYQMYEIKKSDRRRIEAWFGGEQRPLLKGIWQSKKPGAINNNVSRINYEETEWETTCETLELRFKDNLIRLVIDGIISAMPGWLLEKGAVGWVELTTDSAKRVNQSPEKYIVGFHLHKNAYKTQDEIDKDLQSILDTEIKKAEANG